VALVEGRSGCDPDIAWVVMMLVWICTADASKLMSKWPPIGLGGGGGLEGGYWALRAVAMWLMDVPRLL
jgi:hypothetical protein